MQTAVPRMTREGYLSFEETSETKHEFFDGEVFAMTGGSFEHSSIAVNILSTLKVYFKGRNCRPMNSDMRVHTPSGLDTYPDISVYCGEPELVDNQRTLLNPVLIVEVLSSTTSSYDRGDKFQLYRSIPTLQDYLLVDSRRVLVEHFRRTNDGEWVLHVYQELSDAVSIESIQESLALEAVYEDVLFEGEV